MKTDRGDLWAYPADYRVVTTNTTLRRDGTLVMGAGLALQAAKRFPGLPAKLGRWTAEHGGRVFVCKPEGVIAFPTKFEWQKPSPPALVKLSAIQLAEVCDKFGIASVVMPPVGCGLGGLAWAEVERLIGPYLDDRFTVLLPG